MYPAELVKPMREQLTDNGFNELFSENDVDNLIDQKGTTLIIVNSVFEGQRLCQPIACFCGNRCHRDLYNGEVWFLLYCRP